MGATRGGPRCCTARYAPPSSSPIFADLRSLTAARRLHRFDRRPVCKVGRTALSVNSPTHGPSRLPTRDCEAPTMKTARGVTLIANGRLVDGTGAAAVPDAAVLVRDGRIAYAGPARGAPEVPPDAAHVDARGGTILPGLVEAHFHPTYFNVA